MAVWIAKQPEFTKVIVNEILNPTCTIEDIKMTERYSNLHRISKFLFEDESVDLSPLVSLTLVELDHMIDIAQSKRTLTLDMSTGELS